MIGFSKKILLADSLAPLADAAFDGSNPGMIDSWLGTFAYSMQLYFDFSGYSDMAIGLAHMFGYAFPKNFDSPYRSGSITEFWRRWHVTLSQWLRDYLYIPLGGNRMGERRTFLNLFLTMLLGGLWHGASWMFALWGGYHGGLMALERFNGKRPFFKFSMPVLNVAVTFMLVLIGWALFRAHDLTLIKALFGAGGIGGIARVQEELRPFALGALALSPIVVWGGRQSWHLAQRLTPAKAIFFSLTFLVSMVKMIFASYTPFLYYQF